MSLSLCFRGDSVPRELWLACYCEFLSFFFFLRSFLSSSSSICGYLNWQSMLRGANTSTRTSFMTGAVSITCIFQLPLRYQTSAGLSALQAGLRLIPFSVCGPLGTVFCAALSKKRRVPPIYLAIAGELMQIIGLVFLARGDPADPDWRGLYGLEVVVGIGFGLCLGAVSLMVPFVVEKRDLG